MAGRGDAPGRRPRRERHDDEQPRRRRGRWWRAIYGLGIFGALVWFWQQADTFWEHPLAILQGLFWPAFLVYEVFRTLT
ncbi:hypothetical protein GCM10011354_33910 [Egicoccus halophilus]|uniref:Uncharacterized protein n=1 Tax=Egicoccus halophilus TaxID=1670830 RepID=A0A8J3ETE3_9ACTN|nr:hypothetical protein GCM10011354_33910 [Egicoccus halophilus]